MSIRDGGEDLSDGLKAASLEIARVVREQPVITIEPAEDVIADPPLARLYRFWLELHGGEAGLPHYRRIDPAELRFILGCLNIAEPMDAVGSEFRFRLGGTDLARRYGYELTGRTLAEAFPPAAACFYRALYRECYRRGIALHVTETPTDDVPVAHWHWLLLPFAGNNGHPARILSGVQAGPARSITSFTIPEERG